MKYCIVSINIHGTILVLDIILGPTSIPTTITTNNNTSVLLDIFKKSISKSNQLKITLT